MLFVKFMSQYMSVQDWRHILPSAARYQGYTGVIKHRICTAVDISALGVNPLSANHLYNRD